jgi:hypothetical protein
VTVLWCVVLTTVEPVRAERPVVGAVYMGRKIVLMAGADLRVVPPA